MKSCWCEVTNEFRCCQDCEDSGRCNDQCPVFRGWEDESECKGDSFHKSGSILRTLYPDGIRIDQYDDLLTVTRVIDKLFRVATDRDALGESPWRDIAGYAILASK